MDAHNEVQKKQISQVINSKKVSDHHAIIPTKTCADTDLSGLPSGEMRILMLIACRFLAAVSEPHRYAETRLMLSCGGREFTSKGKEVLYEGWKRIERHFRPVAKEDKDGNSLQSLPEEIRESMTLPVQKAEVKEGKTTPPKRFTEDTMLSSMESAGAHPVSDADSGLGAEACAHRARRI